MLDDIDRDCCATFAQMVKDNIPRGWRVVKEILHDPAITFVLDRPGTWHVGNPTVTLKIEYGNKAQKKEK